MYITLHYARASSFGSIPIVFRLRWACHFLPWLTTTFPCRCRCCGTTNVWVWSWSSVVTPVVVVVVVAVAATT